MPHNVTLPRHRYVWVAPSFVLRADPDDPPRPCVQAVWVGVSVTPGRALGCHVLLESGALVVDVPLHALRAAHGWPGRVHLSDVVTWDCYGWDAEAWEPPYLSGLDADLLTREHTDSGDTGTLWFALDHVGDGYSLEPAQHKHLWIVHRHRDDALCLLPQDQLLVHEASFTDVTDIPPIRRQDVVWQAEG